MTSSPTAIKDQEAATPADGLSKAAASDNDSKKSEQIPVTLLSGFLGSGKTTLLKHILESNDHKMRVAVVVSDMAELSIDAALAQQQSAAQTEREVVSLQNGCICCALRGDLTREIAREIARIRASASPFDYVLIESTGIAEPQQVAQAFVFDPATQQLAQSETDMLRAQARLGARVTVIDAHMLLTQMATLQNFSDELHDGLGAPTPEGLKEGEKPIATLLMDQVELANVILLNKTDLVDSPEQITKMKQLTHSLSPQAKTIATERSKIDLKETLNTSVFDMKEASSSPGWAQEARKIETGQVVGHASEADERGVSSFACRARTPFHPQRIAKWVDSISHFANEHKRLPKELRADTASDPKRQHMLKERGCALRGKGFCLLVG